MPSYAIIFGSFLHGVGRSFIIKHLSNYLENLGYSTIKLSVGDIFREIAVGEYNMSIEEFTEYLLKNKRLSREIDIKTDIKMKNKILDYISKNSIDFILVDGNIVPYYIVNDASIKILVDADINIVANRVYRYSRKGDAMYSSIKEAKLYLIKRTQSDIIRYKDLATYIYNNKLEDLYWLADSYFMFYNRVTKPFNMVLNNNSGIEVTIKNIVRYLHDLGVLQL